MTGYLIAVAFLAGVAAERYGRTALWWVKWLGHRARGHHS